MNSRILKELSLLVAGALAGLLATLILETDTRWLLVISVSISFILITCYGLSILNTFVRCIVQTVRNARSKGRRMVGILDDISWTADRETISSWTHVKPCDWIERIHTYEFGDVNKRKLRANKISLKANLNRYNIVLNPYGGVYPESDTVKMVNLEKIFSFVSEGGLFLNVADVPGYWMYNTRLGTKVDATPSTYGVLQHKDGLQLFPIRPFEKTPFMEKLSIRVVNSSDQNDSSWKYSCTNNFFVDDEIPRHSAERLAIVEKNIQPIILIEGNSVHDKCSPLFYVPYGKGKFLFNLYFLDRKYPQNMILVDKLIRIVQKL